jgi:hypothetical protein
VEQDPLKIMELIAECMNEVAKKLAAAGFSPKSVKGASHLDIHIYHALPESCSCE